MPTEAGLGLSWKRSILQRRHGCYLGREVKSRSLLEEEGCHQQGQSKREQKGTDKFLSRERHLSMLKDS